MKRRGNYIKFKFRNKSYILDIEKFIFALLMIFGIVTVVIGYFYLSTIEYHMLMD